MGHAYIQMGRYGTPWIHFNRQAIRLSPTVLPSYIWLGALYEKQGRREEALAIDPRFAPALNNLAWLHAERAETLAQALSLAQRAKEVLPEDPLISDTLGWIFYKKRLDATTIRSLREAAERAPQNPTIHYHLGLAYQKQGDLRSAKGELQEALRLNLEAIYAEEARRLLQEMGAGR